MGVFTEQAVGAAVVELVRVEASRKGVELVAEIESLRASGDPAAAGDHEPAQQRSPVLGGRWPCRGHIVELHGRRIQAASAGLGLGATFTVRIPVEQRDEQAAGAVTG